MLGNCIADDVTADSTDSLSAITGNPDVVCLAASIALGMESPGFLPASGSAPCDTRA